ncbi:ABC-type Fe3+-hydroxamate transport system periplasmic component [Rubrobacter radiotolerans]|uniref:ABC-type Fe3+-hydroxamate transport system periplasmic component n=1 Tax=Rubrobacter radiotolerans TaxID=42256 RepID=A0A023WZD6_RUBRA|nr:iron-siderophore ABC transporter substrate-binding protein [Rubrobacter radiotolerans]AHY45453.1 ABC-type Fe3+-hydroxamate transport system periplasmic component [Rubrobacter radiotolerans]MDX5892864.1 iron-siderophore ABC transporter substrate-binding protein [Rubrobacter radiotolerans]SMC02649.1 iron complex transport system substrate-binding protein [Rubrobacter radiotolerans DSM 5868]
MQERVFDRLGGVVRGGLSRREFLAGVGGMLVLGAAGCGGGSGGSEGGSGGSAQTRTVEHKYGSTEIEGMPERVVSLGYQEHDYLYALGVSPVGVRYWYGDENDVIREWAEDAAGDADPEILNMPEGLNFEAIAALEPDLIVGAYSGMTQEDYDTLSEIAPTVAQSEDYIDYGMPWQETTQLLGRAVGRPERAEELVAEVEAQFEEARRQNPQFEGKTISIATYTGESFGVFAEEDLRSRFFTSLGFTVPEEFTELAGDSFFANLSEEQVELLEADVLVWDQISFTEGGRRAIEENPLINRIPAMQEGRVVYLEGLTEEAFGWQSPLSIPYALEQIVPMLAEATEADGQTTTEETTG